MSANANPDWIAQRYDRRGWQTYFVPSCASEEAAALQYLRWFVEDWRGNFRRLEIKILVWRNGAPQDSGTVFEGYAWHGAGSIEYSIKRLEAQGLLARFRNWLTHPSMTEVKNAPNQ